MSRLFIVIFFLMLYSLVSSQTTGIKPYPKITTELENVEKAIANNNEELQAQAYFNLGNIYDAEQNYALAESYFKKALDIYNRLGLKNEISTVSRRLAQVQEKMLKNEEALENFRNASNSAIDMEQRSINSNDISRLNTSNSTIKKQKINENLKNNTRNNNTKEVVQQYSQLADINIKERNIKEATRNLDEAYQIARNTNPNTAVELISKKVDLLKNNNQVEQAIQEKEKLIKETFVAENSKLESQQLQELAQLYEEKNDYSGAITALKNSYDIALEKGHTLEAQSALKQMDSLYILQNKTQERLLLYKDFVRALPNIINKDSALINEKVLRESEEKVKILEREQQLNTDLVAQKNYINYGLIFFAVLLIGLLIYAFRLVKKLRTQNKKIALQSLSKDMNPHFIFNSLNSINQFIGSNDEKEANKYLSRFSKLMRSVLENSNKDFVPLEEEIHQLQNYLELEHQRFSEQFDYEITVNPDINTHEIQIPVMLLQPFLENAIWHGLRYKQEKGKLWLTFDLDFNSLKIMIKDNGIGREASQKQKTENQKLHNGIGIETTLKRIQYLNELYKTPIETRIIDLPMGTQINITLGL